MEVDIDPVAMWGLTWRTTSRSPRWTGWSIIRQLRGEERSEMIDFLDDSELQCCWEDGCEDVDGGG